jgi:hypothetical protein
LLTENSVHVLIRTIDDLCSTFTALGAAANSYDLIHQRRVDFVRLASDVLLRMAGKVSKDRTSMKDYPSLVVFIDMVRSSFFVNLRDLMLRNLTVVWMFVNEEDDQSCVLALL